MSKIESSAGKALYEQQETKLSQQSTAFIELLTKRGILGDSSIDDDRVRQAKKEKKKSMYIPGLPKRCKLCRPTLHNLWTSYEERHNVYRH